VTYQIQPGGTTVQIAATEIDNPTTSNTGTLRLELWAFPAPYMGQVQTGYILGTFQEATLSAGYHYANISHIISYTPPPNGIWYVTFMVAEYTGGAADSGYSPAAYVTFSNPLQVGSTATTPSRLTNLSVRSTAASGSQTLIAGFVVSGSGSKSVLARGIGPALAPFGVTGILPDPVLSLFNGAGAKLASDAGWGGSQALINVFNQVGAFALPSGSKDSAMDQTLPAGPYSAQVSSAGGGSGIVLVEVYDADSGPTSSRFANLSARSQVGTGAQALIAGFYIAGNSYETVLVRGVGPGLSPFGVSGVLAAPQLTLYDSAGNPIASNSGWSSSITLGSSSTQAAVAAATANTFSQVGAFSLPASSADSALVATLPPGSYSANVSGVGNTTGVALVEVYEVSASAAGSGTSGVSNGSGNSSGGGSFISPAGSGGTGGAGGQRRL
jgi:hypothetical protein